jgi:hypothetical protein
MLIIFDTRIYFQNSSILTIFPFLLSLFSWPGHSPFPSAPLGEVIYRTNFYPDDSGAYRLRNIKCSIGDTTSVTSIQEHWFANRPIRDANQGLSMPKAMTDCILDLRALQLWPWKGLHIGSESLTAAILKRTPHWVWEPYSCDLEKDSILDPKASQLWPWKGLHIGPESLTTVTLKSMVLLDIQILTVNHKASHEDWMGNQNAASRT